MSDKTPAPVVTALTPKEIACLTIGVPASGTPDIDAIITQGLRFKVATEIMAGLVGALNYSESQLDNVAVYSVKAADKLLKVFQSTS